jgi:FkbM family methyltransferase
MQKITKIKHSISSRVILYARKLIVFFAKITGVDLIMAGYRDQGISNSGNSHKTGEGYVIKSILPNILTTKTPVLFDVGANIGEYSAELRKTFPQSRIYAFEPNPPIYKKLKENVSSLDIASTNIGLGSEPRKSKLYSYKDASGLGTIHKEALQKLYNSPTPIDETDITISTVDLFCSQNNIKYIDFLKIDVEGQELSVIKGASGMIKNGSCPVIQFEFNNFNVVSRVFLNDFYALLPEYHFYRLKMNGLVPLGEYSTSNEIFMFQNIIAIHKKVKWTYNK